MGQRNTNDDCYGMRFQPVSHSSGGVAHGNNDKAIAGG